MAGVLVPLAQGFEELEAITVVDLLRRAKLEVTTASLDGLPVKGRSGCILIADTSLEQALTGDYDMVVLPGGLPGADNLNADARIHLLLQKMAAAERYTAAICAAPKVLAQAGLLRGKQATAFPGTLEKLELPDTQVSPQAVVLDGKVITSKGPGTAIDFSLTLIELLAGRETRDRVEMSLQRSP